MKTLMYCISYVHLLLYNYEYIMEYVDLHSSMWSSKHLDQFSDAPDDLGLCVEEMMKTINFDEDSDITVHSTSSRNQTMTF